MKLKADIMSLKVCDGCGGKATHFGVYAICPSCKDKAIEEFVSKQDVVYNHES